MKITDEILSILLAAGTAVSVKDIADVGGLNEHTVRKYARRLFRKGKLNRYIAQASDLGGCYAYGLA